MRWKKDPRETGLRAVSAGLRSSTLRIDGVRVATVSAIGGGYRGPVTGWYFVAGWSFPGVLHLNTCGAPAATEDEAKEQAAIYVRRCLAAAKPTEPTLPTQAEQSHD